MIVSGPTSTTLLILPPRSAYPWLPLDCVVLLGCVVAVMGWCQTWARGSPAIPGVRPGNAAKAEAGNCRGKPFLSNMVITWYLLNCFASFHVEDLLSWEPDSGGELALMLILDSISLPLSLGIAWHKVKEGSVRKSEGKVRTSEEFQPCRRGRSTPGFVGEGIGFPLHFTILMHYSTHKG